jgi:hypothetical protein
MRITLKVLLLLMFFCLTACAEKLIDSAGSFPPGSLIINEIMGPAQQLFGPADSGVSHGWIEIHNTAEQTISLSGWELSYSGAGASYRFPGGLSLGPDRYLLIWMRPDDPEFSDSINSGIELSGNAGTLSLTDPAGEQIDRLSFTEHYNHPLMSTGRYRFRNFPTLFTVPFTTPTPGSANRVDTIGPEASFPLGIGDPSGITTDATGGSQLWVVGDDPGDSVYKITRTGEIIKVLDRYQGEDVEGITQHPGNFSLWIAEERQRALVNIDTLGFVTDRIELDIPTGEPNNGIEGITIHPQTYNLYAVNKRNPRLFLEVSPQGEILQKIEMNFGAESAGRGISMAGLWYDAQDDVIWLASDESRALFILSTEGETLAVYIHGLIDIEGIAGDRDRNILFLVSDNNATLYHIPLPDNVMHLRRQTVISDQ